MLVERIWEKDSSRSTGSRSIVLSGFAAWTTIVVGSAGGATAGAICTSSAGSTTFGTTTASLGEVTGSTRIVLIAWTEV